jgi:hypothetical protein
MTLDEVVDGILESAKKNYETRQERLRPLLEKSYAAPNLPFKAGLTSVSGSKSPAKHLPAKSQFHVTPNQKILDPREDAKKIAVGLVDANKGKVAEARRDKQVGGKDIGLTEPEKVGN